MNPRLRDCLDCYRAKRKERRRGGADRHKNVIQHPLAQQAAAKAPSAQAAELAASAASVPRQLQDKEISLLLLLPVLLSKLHRENATENVTEAPIGNATSTETRSRQR